MHHEKKKRTYIQYNALLKNSLNGSSSKTKKVDCVFKFKKEKVKTPSIMQVVLAKRGEKKRSKELDFSREKKKESFFSSVLARSHFHAIIIQKLRGVNCWALSMPLMCMVSKKKKQVFPSSLSCCQGHEYHLFFFFFAV